MNRLRKTKLNARLRRILKEYHATTNITQEELAELLGISPRACSALENGSSGFSAFSAFMLIALLPIPQQADLLKELCEILLHTPQEFAG